MKLFASIKAKVRAYAMGKTLSLVDPNGWADIFTGVRSASGKIVTRETALRCSAVLACVRILMEDVGCIPHILKKRSKQGASEAVKDPRYRLLRSAPNPLQTALEVREHMILDALMTGKFFNYIPRDGAGRPSGIYPLDASALTYGGVNEAGEPYWNSGDVNFPQKQVFTASELWRGTLLNTNFVEGRSITLLAREAIGLAIAAEEQGARLFSNGIQTDFVLESDEAVENKDQLKSALMERAGGVGNSWLPLVLEGGLKAKRLGLTAQESQYIESRQYQLADVARILRIPGVLIGLNDTATYASASEFFQRYGKHTILPWTVRIEQTADRDLILPNESDLFTTHKLSALMRADDRTRMETHKLAIEGGFKSPAEARADEEWDEVDGLDVTWRPSNYVAIRDGKTIPDTQPDGANPSEKGPKMLENPPKKGSSDKLAAAISASILRSENREFARIGRKKEPSEAQMANFAAWHVEKVMELTGASGPAARSYSDWRFLNPDAEDEARQRLVTLCLEGEQ